MADWIVETLHVWKPDLTALLASAQKSWRQQKSCVDPVPKCGVTLCHALQLPQGALRLLVVHAPQWALYCCLIATKPGHMDKPTASALLVCCLLC